MVSNISEDKANPVGSNKSPEILSEEKDIPMTNKKPSENPSERKDTPTANNKLLGNPSEEKNIEDMSYPELALYVIKDYYTRGLNAPNQTEIVKRILILLEEATGMVPGTSSVQSSVSRALKKYVKEERIIESEERRYTPYNDETSRVLLKKEIINTVKFGPQPVFQISSRAWLIDVERNSLSTAKNLFSKYLGSICYNVLEFNGYLMLLFSGKSADTKEVREEILKIYKAARDADKKGKNQ